jgi:hypothetical protein
MHHVKQRFKTVSALCSALWHEFEGCVPDEGIFNIGYFKGKQHTKKWLVSNQDLDVMYAYFHGKSCISLWCDGKEQDDCDGSKKKCETQHSRKRDDEVEDIIYYFKS